MTKTRPPRISHIGYRRDDCFADIANRAATALHMGKGERALLGFYAVCSSGFRPSLQAIANVTGQDRSQVYRNRNALIKHGIVAERSDALIVDWNRLKLYASLDPRLTSKRSICAPLVRANARMSLLEFKSSPMTDLIPRLSVMTDSEYADLRQRIMEDTDTKRHVSDVSKPSIPLFLSTAHLDSPPAA